jgi:hypothetical protein
VDNFPAGGPSYISKTNMSLPFTDAARKNLRDAEPKLQANLKKLEEATGVAGWTFNPDLVAFYGAVRTHGEQDRVGVLLYDVVLGGLTDNIVRLVADDMCKKDFLEKVPSKVIMLTLVMPGLEGFNGKCSFADGALTLTLHPLRLVPWDNASHLGEDIAQLL